ncbi:MAG: DUF1492 domain-containing protein [Peptoniphilaceae bacterium]
MDKQIKVRKKLNKREKAETYAHNAKLLLKLYKKVNFYVKDRIETMDEHLYETRRTHLKDVVLSVLEVDSFINIEKFEDSLISTNSSILILDLMDLALERLRKYPDKGEIYADLLNLRYFDEMNCTCEQIMSKLTISRSTYYRYYKKAVEAYGNMLFGYTVPDVMEALETIKELPVVAEMANPYKVDSET